MGSQPTKAIGLVTIDGSDLDDNQQPQTTRETETSNPPFISAMEKTRDNSETDQGGASAGKEDAAQDPSENITSSSVQNANHEEQIVQEGEMKRTQTKGTKKTLKIHTVTEEEIPETIEDAKSAIMMIVENYTPENYIENDVLRKGLTTSYQFYFKFKDLSPLKAVQSRREIGNFLVEKGCVPILARIVMDILGKGWTKEDGKENIRVFFFLYNSFILIFNYSDSTSAIAEASVKVPGFFEFLREQLTILYPKHLDKENFSKKQETVLRNILGFVHNVTMEDSARKQLHDLDFTSVLITYLDSPVEKYKMSAILALANLVDEKESELINASLNAVKFLLRSLGKAIKDSSRRHMGWSAKELAHGIAQLAANDSNKKMLVSEGALPLLYQLCSIGDPDDQCEAAGALWALSFDDDNKDRVLNEPGLMNQLVTLSKSPDDHVKKPAQGVLWTLRYKLKDKEEYKEIGEKLIHGRETSSDDLKETKSFGDNSPHVMISYQWTSQPVLLRVRDFLKTNGYKTWMDVDYMGGSTLQAMAEAVENSAVVLICMSPKYKDSPNCRAEAEYAFQRRVPIVPLLMEEDYRPDGWLGILLGSKLFYDFSGKYKFEMKVSGLLKELGHKGLANNSKNKPPGKPAPSKPQDQVDSGQIAVIPPPVQSGIVSAAPPSGPGTSREISKWGKPQVAEWLKKHKMQKSTLSNLTGKHLLFLHNLKFEAPETFYLLLRTNLDLTSLEELMSFVEALTKLL